MDESSQRMDPVFDDSPFYFATERPWGIPSRMQQTLSALVAPVVGLLALFVTAGKPKGKSSRPYVASIVYFACLGMGFIAIELTLLQNLTLLKRNLAEVFGEGDPQRRRKTIGEIYAHDATVYVPPGVIVGHEALDKFAGDLRATHPHYVYTPSGEPQVLHNSARVAWGSGPKGEPPAYTGEDVILVRDGKISALYVYLDQPPV